MDLFLQRKMYTPFAPLGLSLVVVVDYYTPIAPLGFFVLDSMSEVATLTPIWEIQ